MPLDLKGKTAFVTGGASGIGLAMARSFIAEGMAVAIADYDETALGSISSEFSNEKALLLQVDVTDRDGLETAAVKVEDQFGSVHVLCNNAGVGSGGGIAETSYADWDWAMDINVGGVINGLQTFVPRMMRHEEGGHIVNTASLAGVLPVNAQVIYNTSKYAVVGLSESIRKDLAPHGIGVTVLCPGFVATNIFNVKRPGAEPESPSETQTALSESDSQTRSALAAGAIDPAIVGSMVVKGIEQNAMYLFTHTEYGPYVEGRGARIKAGFELSEQILSAVMAERNE
jgi:NAD(P)-dependent dehydrogenase (short-subunit alcohol dehydrogenase family)